MPQIAKNSLLILVLLVVGLGAGVGIRHAMAWTQAESPVSEGDFSAVMAGQPNAVVLFSTPTCPYCQMAREFLDGHGIAYTERDVTSPEHRAAFKALGGEGVPVLYTRDVRISGFVASEYQARFARQSEQ